MPSMDRSYDAKCQLSGCVPSSISKKCPFEIETYVSHFFQFQTKMQNKLFQATSSKTMGSNIITVAAARNSFLVFEKKERKKI